MLFKFLYTLCTIIGVNSHMETPIMINNSIAVTTTDSSITDDTIAISVDEDDTLIRNLCSDFVPYIKNNTCTKTLFVPSQAVDFVAINKTTMILKPRSYDLACYHDEALHATYGEDIYECFPKTYQFTISALNLNNSQLIKEKVYIITVKNISLSGTDKLILGGLMLGTLGICLISCCLAQQKALRFRQRPQVAQAPVSEEMQPL